MEREAQLDERAFLMLVSSVVSLYTRGHSTLSSSSSNWVAVRVAKSRGSLAPRVIVTGILTFHVNL